MPEQRCQVGERLNETTALQLAADLSLAEGESNYIIDFSATQHFEPFAMLLVSSAINRLKRRVLSRGFEVTFITHPHTSEGFAGHMGFWNSIGIPLGREVNSQPGKQSYLPLTRLNIAEMYQASHGSDPLASGLVEQEAARLASILTGAHSVPLLEALTYSLRELIRNVMEHAQTPCLWLAGMSWFKRDYVQVAVLDEGVGIRKSLMRNSQFRYSTDAEAIRASLQPGITRNLNRPASMERIERFAEERHDRPFSLFQNSGYGLYLISSLCREAGQFMLASGSASIGYVGSGEIQTATAHQGTALRLVLNPSGVGDAMERLFSGNMARGPADRKPLLSPSMLKRLGLGELTEMPAAADADEIESVSNDPSSEYSDFDDSQL